MGLCFSLICKHTLRLNTSCAVPLCILFLLFFFFFFCVPLHPHIASPLHPSQVIGALLRAFQDAAATVKAHRGLVAAGPPGARAKPPGHPRANGEGVDGGEKGDGDEDGDDAVAAAARALLARLPNGGGWPLVGASSGRVQEWLVDYAEPDPAHRHWCAEQKRHNPRRDASTHANHIRFFIPVKNVVIYGFRKYYCTPVGLLCRPFLVRRRVPPPPPPRMWRLVLC